MAKISFTPVVGDARGKAGRSVFTKGRSGPVLRVRVRGRNPRSPEQSTVREYMAQAARQFMAFAANTVAAWNAYGATLTHHNKVTGQAYHPSGMGIFVSLAAKYLQINGGGTAPSTIPAAPFVGDGVSATAAGGSGKITWTASGANTSPVKIECLYKKLASAARAMPTVGYKSGAFYAATGGNLTHDVSLDPGTYATAYRLVDSATGQMLPLVTLSIVTVS